MSAPALHRHRAEHLDEPTVGDLLEPADQFDAGAALTAVSGNAAPRLRLKT